MKPANLQRAVFVSSFFILHSAFAEGTAATAPVLPDASASFIRVMGSLALVLGLFLGGVWVFKNWRRFAQPGRQQPRLNILESRSLGGRQAILVVSYEKQRFLIAAAPTGVNLLTHLPEASESDAGDAEKNPAPPSFAQALANVLQKK